MKNIITLFFIGLVLACQPTKRAEVQAPPCDTVGVFTPEQQRAKDSMDAIAAGYIKRKSSMRMASDGSLDTIAVVVRIVWNKPEHNISDAQVLSQIAALNRDFNKRNADTTKIPPFFKPRAGSAGIYFKLATRTPDGKPTNGITRKQTSVLSFSSDGNVCFDSLGGDNIWDAKQYLNIYVFNKTGAGGYSSYPWSGSPGTDCVLMGYNYFGTIPPFANNWSYLQGRTCVHEVGHWLGLAHIWGDFTCGDDLVADTPPAYAANGSCPDYPHKSPTCNPDTNGDMFMSYMDYTQDDCRQMFSNGQCDRANSYLHTTRAGLLTSLAWKDLPGTTPTPTIIPPTACLAPRGLSVDPGIYSASASWEASGTSYWFFYRTTGAFRYDSVYVNINTYNLTGLKPWTNYQIWVKKKCGTGVSPSTIVYGFKTKKKLW